MKKLLQVIVLGIMLSACTSGPAKPPPPTAECVAVCDQLREKDCDHDGAKTTNGKPCEEWLCNKRGVKLSCIHKAMTCPQIESFQEHGCP